MQQLSEFCRLLSEHRVRFVIVGGLAVILHGHLRATGDVDLVVDLGADELGTALSEARAAGFYPRVPVDLEHFAVKEKREEWKREKGMLAFTVLHRDDPLTAIDLLVETPIDFEKLFDRAVRRTLRGQRVAVASIADLIAMKSAAGRDRDLQDIEALKSLESQKTEENRDD